MESDLKNNNREQFVDSIIIELKTRLPIDGLWDIHLRKIETSQVALHLAIFNEPYLGYILEGKKTIESRFSINRVAPYKQIFLGDIVLLKKASGPIIGICIVTDAWFYKLDQPSWDKINNDFFMEIYVFDQDFWREKHKSCFATLIKFQNSMQINPPLNISKKDRRGWVILKPRNFNVTLDYF